MWKVCKFVKNIYMNVEKIFPLNQHAVECIVEHAKSIGLKGRVIIFGSSIKSSCNPWSDVDCFVEGCNREEWGRFFLPDNQSLDIFFDGTFSHEERLYKDIMEEGVIVYE